MSFELLYFHMGDAQQGDEFFGRFDPEARAVSDPEKIYYRAFGLERGSLLSVMGPSVWVSGAKSLLKGNSIGKPVGDPLMMPGLFVVHERRVVWRQHFANTGERPRLEVLQTFAAALHPGTSGGD